MTVEYKSEQEIDSYKSTKSSFVDYTRFEGDATYREAEKQAFIQNETYTPKYDYSKLDNLNDDVSIRDKKSKIHEAVLELEAAKSDPDANLATLELYRSFLELRLKKIMLVEAARNLHTAGTSSAMETAREAFMQMNEETYGEFNESIHDGMMTTEAETTAAFEPKNEIARKIKAELSSFYSSYEVSGTQEAPLMSAEDLQTVHDVLMKRYKTVLSAVPDTDDSVYYTADECAVIMNQALVAGGLAQEGWRVIVDPEKSSPATKAEAKLISLPINTKRNTAELKRLILHEQEVHARRGYNGRVAEFGPLAEGTADYADVEEGLGVFLESALAGNFDNPSFHRARDRYITTGLAMGANGDGPRDARQVFDILWRMVAVRNAKDGIINDESIDAAKSLAYGHVENAFRGTPFWRQGVIYTKLKVYYEGLEKNARFFKDNIDDIDGAIDRAMLGKYNHTDEHEHELIMSSLESIQPKSI